MIIFQITLSGKAIRHLLAVKHETMPEQGWPDHYVATSRQLQREGLITHLDPIKPNGGTSWDDPPQYSDGRKFHCQITPKGELVLQLVATDLKDFLNELRDEIGLPKIDSRRIKKRLVGVVRTQSQ